VQPVTCRVRAGERCLSALRRAHRHAARRALPARRCRRGACMGRAGPLCAPPLPTGAPRAGADGGSGALRLLLACGADADARDEAGDRPLHLVCRAGIDLQTYPHGDDLQALPHSIALHYIDAAKRAATAHRFGAHDLSAQTRPGPSASGVADSGAKGSCPELGKPGQARCQSAAYLRSGLCAARACNAVHAWPSAVPSMVLRAAGLQSGQVVLALFLGSS